MALGCSCVHGVTPSGNFVAAFLRYGLYRTRHASNRSGPAMRETRNHGPTATLTFNCCNFSATIACIALLSQNEFTSPNIKQSVTTCTSPQCHLNTAPKAQTASSGEVRHPSITKQGKSATKQQAENDNRPERPCAAVHMEGRMMKLGFER